MINTIKHKHFGFGDGIMGNFIVRLVTVASWKVILASTLMASVALMEGVGLLLLIPLLQVAGLDVQAGSLGQIAKFISSSLSAIGISPTLMVVLSLYVLSVSLRELLIRWQISVSSSLRHGFVAHLRRRLYRAITNANWSFFSRSRSSDFVTLLTIEASRAGEATAQFLRLLAASATVFVFMGFALKLSPAMTALVLACGGGLILALRGRVQTAYHIGAEVSDTVERLFAAVTEHLGGMKLAKSYGNESHHAKIFDGLTSEVRSAHARSVKNLAEGRFWFNTGSVLALGVILYVSLEHLAVSTAEVLLLIYLFTRVIPKLSTVQQSYQALRSLMPAFAAISTMQSRCEAAAEPTPPPSENVALRHNIHIRDVSFSYGVSTVLDGIDLMIPAGKTTAIVGPSGSGKSTIADLIIGLIHPQHGSVLIDGIPLDSGLIRAWRNQIGYVTQDTFMLHDTVRANLLWANPSATEEEIRHALRLASAEELVRGLPQGLDTTVGDRGMQLSGGERQRIALARALLRRPLLLILDEATSALDSDNERYIQQALEELHGSTTILIISHRLSMVQRADIIHLLDQGRVVESGSWHELASQENGRFRRLCEVQGIENSDSRTAQAGRTDLGVELAGNEGLPASRPGLETTSVPGNVLMGIEGIE